MSMVLDSKISHGDKKEMRALAARICGEYLQGAWQHVTPADVTLTRVTGGLSNWLYCVSLEGAQPPRVLLRLYGQLHDEQSDSLLAESVIFTLLSERGLGPKLLAVFPGGRLEHHIDARPLRCAELPQHGAEIACKMAAVHSMSAPLSKRPAWLWNTMTTWLHGALENLNNPGRVKRETQATVARLQTMDLQQEVAWMRCYVESRAQHCPVVFSHNDLQCGNILLPQDTPSPELVLIDFEYCSYNYRGFDLANHLVEYMYDYSHDKPPFFSVHRARYPSRAHQLSFIREYLRSRELHCPDRMEHTSLCDVATRGETEEEKSCEEEEILQEVQVFTMVSHLLWGLWSCVNAKMSDIPFGYWEYASERLSSYLRLKQQLQP